MQTGKGCLGFWSATPKVQVTPINTKNKGQISFSLSAKMVNTDCTDFCCLSQIALSKRSSDTLESEHQLLCSSFCGMPLTGGRKPRWEIYEEEPINPGDLANIPPWSTTKTIPPIWNNHLDAKRVFCVKEWISGPVAIWSNKWHRMDLVWYLPGLFFQNSHTQSFPRKGHQQQPPPPVGPSSAFPVISGLLAQHSNP